MSIDDFIKKSEKERLNDLLLLFTNIPRALVHLSLEENIVYYNGKDIMEGLFKFIGYYNKDIFEYIPKTDVSYLKYIKEKDGTGVLTKIGITKEEEYNKKIGYRITDFGIITKGFLSYILKEFIKLKLSPTEILSQAEKNINKNPHIKRFYIIKYIIDNYNENGLFLDDIIKDLNIDYKIAKMYLNKLEKNKLIEYKKVLNTKEIFLYKINIEKVEDYINEINKIRDNYTAKNYIIEKSNYGYFSIKYLKKALKYIKDEYYRNKKYITYQRLSEKLKIQDRSLMSIINVLERLKAIESENNEDNKVAYIIKPKEKLYKIYDILNIIENISKNPYKLIEYKNYRINKEEIKELIKIYSNNKIYYPKKYEILPEIIDYKR